MDNDTWDIVVPLDHATSCNIGKHTDWCTAKPATDEFSDYVFDMNTILVYLQNKQTNNQWAIAFVRDPKTSKMASEIYNQSDDSLSSEEFHTQTGLTLNTIENLVLQHEKQIKAHVETERLIDPRQIIRNAIKNDDASPEMMRKIERIHGAARLKLEYVVKVLHKRWPAIEHDIMKDPYIAADYDLQVLGGKRWPEAEKMFMSTPIGAYVYARKILNGRWPEAEHVIKNDPVAAYWYAHDFIKGKWPEAEKTIMKSPWYAYLYADRVLKRRWPEAENVIKNDPEAASEYAVRILKRRWPEAEKTIMKTPWGAYRYAADVLKRRWPEAEESIKSDPDIAQHYAHNILKRHSIEDAEEDDENNSHYTNDDYDYDGY